MACGPGRFGGRKQEPTEATQERHHVAPERSSVVGIFGFPRKRWLKAKGGEDVRIVIFQAESNLSQRVG